MRKLISLLTKSNTSLRVRVFQSGFWVVGGNVVNKGLSLVRTVILARLLAPNDFGLFGIAMLALATLERFSQTGFDQALIQKNKDIAPYLNTAWTIQILRGFVIGSILFLGAPLVAEFFNEPRSLWLIRVIGIGYFIGSFKNIGIVYYDKNLRFDKRFVYEITYSIIDFVITVMFAIYYKNVWALIFGLMARYLTQVVFSYVIHEFRPRFSFAIDKAKELYHYGKYLALQGIVIFFITQGDNAFVGKFLGASALGFYQIAYRFSNMPATEFTRVISKVTFSAYSKIQSDKKKLYMAFKRVFEFITLITIPISGLLFVTATEFTAIVLGMKWLPMVPALKVLCVFGLIRALGASFGPVYAATGRLDLPLRFNIINLLILVVTIYPLTAKFGYFGTSMAVSLSALPVLFLTVKYMSALLDRNIFPLLKVALVPIFSTSVMILLTAIILNLVRVDSIPYLVLIYIQSVITYISCLLLFSKKIRIGAFKKFREVFKPSY